MNHPAFSLSVALALAPPGGPTPESTSSPTSTYHPAAPWASLAVPGAGQWLMGESTAGAMWLGSGLVAGLGSYAILRAQLPSDALLTPETPQFYFLILVGTAAWLGVGVASTIAGLAVASQQESGPSAKANGLQGKEGQATPALQPVREPTPAPRRRSRPLRRDEDSY